MGEAERGRGGGREGFFGGFESGEIGKGMPT